jgi:lambda family phage tail tape measure protein
VAIGQAMDGNEKFQKSFKDLGVYVTDSNGKIRDSGDILQDVVGKLAGIEDPAVRAARATELLGKEASKIDWSKVSAGKDAIKDEQIAQLSAYRGEIDKLANTLETKLVTAFGELATAVNKGGLVEGLAAAVEQMGYLVSYIPGLGKMADLVDKARMERLGARAGGGRGGQGGPTADELAKYQESQKPKNEQTGGFGGPSEQALKAAADSRQRIAQSEAEARKQLELSTASQIGQIEINAKYEAAKAKAEIDNKERLSNAQKTAEYVAKEREIFSKRDNDIAKARRDLSVRIATEEMAQAEQNAREMAAYYQQVDQARLQAFDQVDSIKQAREELGRRVSLEEKIITLSDREAKNAMDLLSLEEERLKALRAIAAIQNLPFAERLEREKAVNQEYDKGRQLILNRQNTEFEATRSFSKGWEKALADYTESSQNSFQTAGKLFQRVTGGMEDAVVDFAKTGKFEFKGFMASILEDILRSQVRGLIAQLFGLRTGGGSGGGLLGGAIIPGFLAEGGPARAGKPYIVGERGPELFIPGASGAVVPNDALGGGNITNVIYNINAVDTMSFKQLVARDPGFIYAVTEQGRKTVPATRR